MINLAPLLDSRLWAAIESAYQTGNYSGAIVDSIHFLSELIREKSGLDGDGAVLVGSAFGGQNPVLKVNKLQTQSDKDIQKGIEQLLRGLYQGIRNPRSHGKVTDSIENSDAIILFVNYLVRVIDQSKSPFEKDVYIKQVFDPYFTENTTYADLMVDEIPNGKRWDILIEVFRQKEQGNWKKLQYFMAALLKRMSPEEQAQFCEIVSEDLKTTSRDDTIISVLQIIPTEYWPRYSQMARIRIEGKIIDYIRRGKYDTEENKCLSGGVATWARDYMVQFFLKEDLIHSLVAKLASSDRISQDYVFQYFFVTLVAVQPIPSSETVRVIRSGLENGDVRFYAGLGIFGWSDEDPWPQPWKTSLKEAHDKFVAKSSEVGFDQGITDDDVPF
jgi:uncharacterized protein (TIGR02391 family)